ncbi:MAG TPA: TIGR04063 family PEP-CTERM/XrtA system glycosyltransferase [Acetobacteraceae bacterium]|nr:TIGR04063 family PEP-CTERM/XrtA system glycosyltransferase [Acetobacteraceae bacterium]
MRVLHVFDHSVPLLSGYAVRSLGILRAQQGFGWETIAVTGPRHNGLNGAEQAAAEGQLFYRTPPVSRALAARPGLREVAEMRALGRRLDALIAATCPDLVHAHSPVLTGWPALRAARQAHLPFVYEVRGLWEDAAVDLGRARPGDLRYRATRAFETALLHRADGVVTICAGLRAEIAARGVPPARIGVVPNGVDPGRLVPARPPDPALVAALGLEGRTVLGFVGSFYRYEGLDLLLSALPRIRKRLSDVALLLVGSGPEEAALRARAADPALAGSVRFAGRVPHREVGRYYDLIDLLVLPRRRMRLTELVTPLKPLEAMAEGRLVLASDVAGHRELIADGATGFLFRADDPAALAERVLSVLAARHRHEATRAVARRFIAEQRTWPAVAAAYAEIYGSLLRRAPRRSPGGLA